MNFKEQKQLKLNLIFRRQKKILSRIYTLGNKNMLRTIELLLEMKQLEIQKYIVISQPIPKFPLGGLKAVVCK